MFKLTKTLKLCRYNDSTIVMVSDGRHKLEVSVVMIETIFVTSVQ